MKVKRTSDDMRRLSFVDSLYKELHQQTAQAIADHNRIVAKARNYLDDGVSEPECVELLIIDGVNRDAASAYIMEAQEKQGQESIYSFQFEDTYGRTWSSHDINRTISASNDDEAWSKAESIIFNDSSIEPERIISVDRIS